MSSNSKSSQNRLKEYVTEDGIKVQLRMVPHFLIEQITAQIAEPEIPMVWNETKREYQANPLDPVYVQAIADTERLRSSVMYDAIVRLGVILEGGIPPIEEWRDLIEEMDILSNGKVLKGYNLNDPRHQDILYKKYFVLVTIKDVVAVTKETSATPEGVREALSLFQNNKKR